MDRIDVKCLASGSAGNAYAVDDGESVLLLEAGIPAKRSFPGSCRCSPVLRVASSPMSTVTMRVALLGLRGAGLTCMRPRGRLPVFPAPFPPTGGTR